jgi:diguanylate cyclase (GGDEF)-like protein
MSIVHEANRANAEGSGTAAAKCGRGTAPVASASVAALFEQARHEFAALELAFASRRYAPGGIVPELGELKRTIARIGTTAERMELEMARMRHVAYHDPLTGLPNRSLLLDRLDRALAHAARNGGQFSLLLLDLDAFKLVNDRLGHVAGDRLLQQVAERLGACTRDADTVCRYGGDEFVVLLPEAGRRGATDVARKIHECLAASFLAAGTTVTVSACIGCAVFPGDGASPEELLQQADAAMYACKDRLQRRVGRADGRVRYRLLGEATAAVADGAWAAICSQR